MAVNRNGSGTGRTSGSTVLQDIQDYASENFPTQDEYDANLVRTTEKNDRYWSDLFVGTEYEDAYNSIISKYNIDTPDTFWGWLTGKNQTNAYQHEMSKGNDLFALQQKMQDEQYQSYENQVSLMRQAGLNPDLQQVQGGASSQLSPTGIPENVAAENGFSVVGSLASVAMSAVGIAQQFMSTLGSSLSLDSIRLDNLEKMDTYALTYLLDNGVSPLSATVSGDERTVMVENLWKLQDYAYEAGRKDYGFNNRQARTFANSVRKLSDSPKLFEQYYGFMSRGSAHRRDYLGNTSGSFYSQQDEAMRLLIGPLLDAQQNAKKSQDSYNLDYYSNLDGSAIAESQNAVAEDIKVNSQTNKVLLKKWNDSLNEAFDNGNVFAGVLLSILNQFSINSLASILK